MPALRLVEHGVGGDDADGGGHAGLQALRQFAAQQRLRAVCSRWRPSALVRAPASTWPSAGSITSPVALTATSAATVTPPTRIDAVPMPPFIARSMPNSLPTVAPAPAPTLPCAGARVAGGHAGRVAGRGVGPDRQVAVPQIEQHRRRHDRHAHRADRETVAVLFEPAHHAAGGVQAEGAAAGEQHGVHTIDQVLGPQQVGLARAGRAAAHVDTGHRALRAQHDGAAGGARRVREVADREAGDVGDCVGERLCSRCALTTSPQRERG